MQIESLFSDFNKLQNKFGSKTLDPIYGCGETSNPNLFLVFMNPTSKNVSSNKKWKGLKAPWLGTKNIWRLLEKLGIIPKELLEEILRKNAKEWDYIFSEKVYKTVKQNSIYITNLSKATQIDARHLKSSDFIEYLPLLHKEISIINPKIIITFGSQVSSIVLGKNINLKDKRKQFELITIDNFDYKVFPLYYPVGQGIRNLNKTKEDISYIVKKYIN